MPVASPRRRTGVGMLLVVILILVTVMTFIAIARAVFSKGVTSQVLRSSLGVQCQTLAEGAAEEALLQLRAKVNDPSDPIYREIRQEVYRGQVGDFEVRLDPTRVDAMIRNDPDLAAYYLGDAQATIAFQKQFSSAPYERYGLMKVGARVSTDLSFADTVSRRVELGVEFKVHLLGSPRPFDQAAVYVHDGEALLRDPYRRIEDALQDIDDLRNLHEEMTQQLESRKGSITGWNATLMVDRYKGVQVLPREYWRGQAPELRLPAVIYGLGRDAAGIDLTELDIRNRVERGWESVQRTSTYFREAKGRLESSFENSSRHDDYLERLRVLLGAYSEMFGTVNRFRNIFHVFDGANYPELGKFGYKLEIAEWLRKVTHDLDRDPARREPQVQLEELLKAGRLNGVVFTSWNGKSVRLAGRNLPGRIVLVTGETSLELSDLNLQATDRDMLTIVAMGPLRLSGKIHASILALGPVEIAPNTQIEGNLVFDKVRVPEDMAGRASYDRRLFSGRTTTTDTSGAYLDYYYVTLAPRPVYKAVDRR